MMFMIKNLTRKTIIAKNIKVANNFIDKTLGMMLSRNSEGLILKTRFGVHTLFMKSAIDIVILDNQNKVVAIRENLAPYGFFIWNPKFNTVIEVKQGLVKKSKTEIGDILDFQFGDF